MQVYVRPSVHLVQVSHNLHLSGPFKLLSHFYLGFVSLLALLKHSL